jgi:hypothetical protein
MGKNPVHKLGNGNIAGLVLIALSVIMATGLIAGAQGSTQNIGTNASSAVINTICSVFNTIKDAIFILGLALMVLGGAVYAGANLMPSQSRGSFQGYGMAMVIGGIIGVAIAVAAPFILNVIISASGNSGASLLNQTGTVGVGAGTSAATTACANANANANNGNGNNRG